MLFDLVSYCDVRVQSNPFILKGDKRVLKLNVRGIKSIVVEE